MKAIRLDKYLSEMGCDTRSGAKKAIKKHLVTVDGCSDLRPEQKIVPGEQTVVYMGETVAYEAYEYYMLNKPAGCVTAVKDHKEKTVMDYITAAKRNDLSPVGRLDKDTEGLLLITNDGTLAHNLLAPGKHVDKTYYAEIEGVVTAEDVLKFKEGLEIGEKRPTLPAELRILEAAPVSKVAVTIREGKYHQIKRMFERVGKRVSYLKRITMGTLSLDETLEPGEYRALTEKELRELQMCSSK